MSVLLYESFTVEEADAAFYILEVRYYEALKCNQAARDLLLAEGLSPWIGTKRYTLPGELTDPNALARLEVIKAYIAAGAPHPTAPPPPPTPAPETTETKILKATLILIPIAGLLTASVGEIKKRLK